MRFVLFCVLIVLPSLAQAKDEGNRVLFESRPLVSFTCPDGSEILATAVHQHIKPEELTLLMDACNRHVREGARAEVDYAHAYATRTDADTRGRSMDASLEKGVPVYIDNKLMATGQAAVATAMYSKGGQVPFWQANNIGRTMSSLDAFDQFGGGGPPVAVPPPRGAPPPSPGADTRYGNGGGDTAKDARIAELERKLEVATGQFNAQAKILAERGQEGSVTKAQLANAQAEIAALKVQITAARAGK